MSEVALVLFDQLLQCRLRLAETVVNEMDVRAEDDPALWGFFLARLPRLDLLLRGGLDCCTFVLRVFGFGASDSQRGQRCKKQERCEKLDTMDDPRRGGLFPPA